MPVQTPVVGFQISDWCTFSEKLFFAPVVVPPVTSTCPSGSIVSVWYARGLSIDPVACHVGDAAVMSITRADVTEFVLSLYATDPASRTLPGRYITELPVSSAVASIVVHEFELMLRVRVGSGSTYEPATMMRPSGNRKFSG